MSVKCAEMCNALWILLQMSQCGCFAVDCIMCPLEKELIAEIYALMNAFVSPLVVN